MNLLAKEKETKMLEKFVRWGEAHDSVRVIMLTSTRTLPDAQVDAFSDYDVILFVRDILPFYEDEHWLSDFGPVLVLWRDPIRQVYGYNQFARITQYENGLKIDFTVSQMEILQHLAAEPQLPEDLDLGYQILLDKDGLATGLQPPTHQAYIPSPPSEKEYCELVEELFHEATYAAKHLWRDDFFPLKYNLDYAMKFTCLRRMLEWQIEIEHDWSLRLRSYGKSLKKYCHPELWAELEATYTGGDREANWQALFRTIELFRTIAIPVGQALGYAYPYDMDRRATAYLRKVKDLPDDIDVFS